MVNTFETGGQSASSPILAQNLSPGENFIFISDAFGVMVLSPTISAPCRNFAWAAVFTDGRRCARACV